MVDLTSVGQNSFLECFFYVFKLTPHPLLLNLENLKMYFHFLSLVNTGMAEVI